MYLSGDSTLYVQDIRLLDTSYEDLRIPGLALSTGPASSPPDLINVIGGVYAYGFDSSADEEVFFTVQLPHSWKEGTDIEPHVHWMTQNTDTGNVCWKLEYTWANIGDTFGATATVSGLTDASGTDNDHMYTDLETISGAGKTFSSMLICRLYRDVSDDDYNTDAALLEIDFHYQVWRFGTRNELTD